MILIILGVVAIIILGMACWDGAFMGTRYNIQKDVYDEEKKVMSKAEFELIRGGIASASSHNMQPWKIKIVDQKTFSLYADMEKNLPVIDPKNIQMLMSEGTFIGSVKEEAKKLGLALDVQYAPIDLNKELKLIATFHILGEGENEVDAVSSATRGVDVDVPMLNQEKILELTDNSLPGFQTLWIEEEQKSLFQTYLQKGTMIEASNQKAMEELLKVFRFTKWEKNQYRYGLSLNTITPPLRMFIEPIVGATATWESFGKNSITAFEQRMKNEAGYLVISCENPKFSDYIRMGEALSQMSLSIDGFTMRPAVQLIEPLEGMTEVYDEMKEVFDIQGEVVQVIGFTKRENGYHDSVRHQVMDIIIQ